MAVLIADAEEAVCFGLAGTARWRGPTPLVTGTGAGADELVRTYPGPLVGAVLDVGIARPGYGVLAALLALGPNCPVVWLIVQAGDPREAAGRIVLQKPFELSTFSSCLDSFLGEAAR